jgi:Type IV secretion-system coupling protein DNA-binding domain
VKAAIREAIYERMTIESLKLRLRTALRTVILVTTLWAEFSVFLVWYWAGHECGPQAHRYFFEWFAAWFLTQVIPLTFASLPYRGGHYTVTSMYRFLNARYYLGGSFSSWYWHCAPAGAVITGAAVAALACSLRASDRGYDLQHVRGVMLVPVKTLARRLRAVAGIWLAGVRIPRQLESQHFLIVGSTGAGKSVAIRALLRQIERRQEVSVVVDPESEFVGEFYRPERGDYILNPLDARCPVWSPWFELRPESYEADCEALAASLIPDPPDVYHEGGASFFFRQSSRTLLTSIFRVAEPRQAATIPKLLALPRAELRQKLAGTPAEALIDPGAHEQGAGIVATAANATNHFHYLPERSPRRWSALDWSKRRRRWLFLTSSEESRDAALPLQSVWLDCIIHRLMAGSLQSSHRVWIVADELPVLRRQARLEDLVVRGRKRGLAVVLGFQAITQLRAIYGNNQAATLVASPATKLILRTGEPETAQWCSSQIGEREVNREQLSASTGTRNGHGSFSLHQHRATEAAVMASEIQLLQPLSGYLCITGHHRAFVRFSYVAPTIRQERFISRVNLPSPPPPAPPRPPAKIIRLRPARVALPHRKRI